LSRVISRLGTELRRSLVVSDKVNNIHSWIYIYTAYIVEFVPVVARAFETLRNCGLFHNAWSYKSCHSFCASGCMLSTILLRSL